MADRNKHQADSQNLQVTAGAWREKIEQEYTYCMISTLNQMVNYLPILLFDFQQPKMYVTLKRSEQNKSYDKCLFSTCTDLQVQNGGSRFSIPSDKVEIGDLNDVGALQSTLSQKASGKKMLWNITGGQRPFLMAIFELLKQREDDLVMYLEGNSTEVVFLEVKNKTLQKVEFNQNGFESYAVTNPQLQWLNIGITLQLMGFDTNKVTITKNQVKKPEHSTYQTVIQTYKTCESLRKKLLALNKQNDHDESGTIYKTKAILGDEANKATYFEELTPEAIQLLVQQKELQFPFGHFLEKLYAHAIHATAKEGIAEMATNVRLHYADEDAHLEAGKNHIDELDIAILTKNGQLVVFEVKSGAMSGDVAKSTKYTTYAIAGVYGKPILLTALLKDQLKDTGSLRNHWAYASSATAVAAAKRAQLPVISLDGNEDGDFETAIKKLLKLS